MNELNGGSVIGNAEPVLDGDLIGPQGDWNEHTLSWEIVLTSRVQAKHDLVQQRNRYADFSRQYERYNAASSERSATAELPGGHDDPEVAI